jgi:hypothetical protein
MNGDTGRIGERHHVGDGLDRAHLVVDPQGGEQGNVVSKFRGEVCEVNRSQFVNANEINDRALCLNKPMDGVERSSA